MSLFGRSPVNGPSQYLDARFQEWWYVLNSIGIFSFTLLIGSMDCGKNRYFAALASSVLVAWLLFIAKSFFPNLVKIFRRSNDNERKDLARVITRDYLGVITMPFAYFPYFFGVLGLWSFALYPVIIGQWHLYIPVFIFN